MFTNAEQFQACSPNLNPLDFLWDHLKQFDYTVDILDESM